MKFKNGDKVVPHQKTVAHYGDLNSSSTWKGAIAMKQPFLFVKCQNANGIYSCDEFHLPADKLGGDFFNEEDLTLYSEDTVTNNYELF